MNRIRVSIAGASGYAGAELIRLLLRHPQVELQILAAGEQSGRMLSQVFPSFAQVLDRELQSTDWNRLGAESDCVFLALPHGVALEAVPTLLDSGARVIDLGADYRLRDRETYQRTYGLEHTTPQALAEAVYGLPELHRESIGPARLVANPGCYPTATALALLPIARYLDAGSTVVVDAKSGVSGAGRKAGLDFGYSEVNESVRPYGVFAHRHAPEMEQTLADAGGAAQVAFAPHLVPMTRGILSACYVRATDDLVDLGADSIVKLYHSAYRNEPFVRFDKERLPTTKGTLGSNFCDLSLRFDEERRMIVVLSAIDNLVKGAAGQAIQNLNSMHGLAETTGLEGAPLFP